MTIKTTGSKFHLGTTSVTPTSDTYARIKGVVQAGGTMGLMWDTTPGTTFDEDYKQNLKTIKDGGSLQLKYHRDPTDAGQVALDAAALDKGDTPYNLKIEIGNPVVKIAYLPVRVISARPPGMGSPGQLWDYEARLDITGAITFADPA